MTYVGSVFSSGTRDLSKDASPEVYGINKLKNIKGNMTDITGRKDFVNFAIKGDYKDKVLGVWRIYAQEDDLFYSEKETTNIKDLKPLSTVEWTWGTNKKYYIYKKGKVDTPSGMTYIGSFFSSGTRDVSPEVYGINKLKNISVNLVGVSSNKDFDNFQLKVEYKDQVLGIWRAYSKDDDLFYSEKETTNINDLKSFSCLEWTWGTNKKYYIYKKGKIDTPSGMTYVGSIHTTGTNSLAYGIYVENKVQNVEDHFSATNTSKEYNDFSIKYTSGSWNILSNNNLFYSEKETTDESNLKSFSKLTWGYNVNKKYYIYKKK